MCATIRSDDDRKLLIAVLGVGVPESGNQVVDDWIAASFGSYRGEGFRCGHGTGLLKRADRGGTLVPVETSVRPDRYRELPGPQRHSTPTGR